MSENKKIIIIFAIMILLFGIVAFKNKEKEETNVFLNVDQNFLKADYLNKGIPVMYDLGGDDCISCKLMKDTLIELNQELKDKATIKFVDVVEFSNLAEQFNFKIIPTQFFYDSEGNLKEINEGTLSKQEILDIFSEMGYDFD